jgi:hypothetical protein
MKIAFAFIFSLLLLFIPVNGFVETVYDQPYLGEFPTFVADRFSTRAWKKNAESNLAALVRQSDLIVVAESKEIVEAPESTDRLTFYDANVRILKVVKGKPTNADLRLKFRAFTTGIGIGSRHIFFLRETREGFEVLRSSFVYPRGQGFDNHMVLFGSTICSEKVGIAVIMFLANQNGPQDLEQSLTNEYLSDQWDKTYSAVHLASATAPAFGASVLTMAVVEKERKRFDIDLYGTAAYALALQRKQENWQIMLENIPVVQGGGRMAESIAFDLAANFGDEGTVRVIRDVVAGKPELAVSAAFALSGIGGKKARSVIEDWLRDPALSKRAERISTGWTTRTETFSTLFAEALEKMNLRQREQKPIN